MHINANISILGAKKVPYHFLTFNITAQQGCRKFQTSWEHRLGSPKLPAKFMILRQFGRHFLLLLQNNMFLTEGETVTVKYQKEKVIYPFINKSSQYKCVLHTMALIPNFSLVPFHVVLLLMSFKLNSKFLLTEYVSIFPGFFFKVPGTSVYTRKFPGRSIFKLKFSGSSDPIAPHILQPSNTHTELGCLSLSYYK